MNILKFIEMLAKIGQDSPYAEVKWQGSCPRTLQPEEVWLEKGYCLIERKGCYEPPKRMQTGDECFDRGGMVQGQDRA